MTGAIAFGYDSQTDKSNATASGLGMDDAEINFAISEDIEGLGKLAAKLGFGSGGRGDTATGNDSTISLTTASGIAITGGTTKGSSYFTQGIASAGTAYQWDLSGKLFSKRTINDAISVKVPVADGVSVSVAHSEAAVSSYWTGTGATGNGTEQRYNTLSVDYSAGPLAINAGYRAYDNGLESGTTTLRSASSDVRNRAALSYDLGLAKIGAGYEQTKYKYGNKKTDSLLGINVPLGGALNVGAQVAQSSTTDNASSSDNQDRNGYLLVANYNLSKRTYLVANYYQYSAGDSYSTRPSGYGVFLYNNF